VLLSLSSARAGRVATTKSRLRPHLPASLDLRFSAAERYFGNKVSLTRAEFDLLQEQVRVYSFTVARVTSIHLLDDIQSSIQREIIEGGHTYADFQKNVAPGLMAKHGWSGANPWHMETILRTNTQMAYGVGQLEGLMRVQSEFPFWRYSAIGDSRTRPSHMALNNRIYPANHPFWRLHFPPWGYNCRCDVIPLMLDQIGDEQIWTDMGPEVEHNFTGPGQLLELFTGNATPESIAERMTMSLRAIHQAQLMDELRSALPLHD
jgi:SPP1 gp7 family putative phage head morphogenesis protein